MTFRRNGKTSLVVLCIIIASIIIATIVLPAADSSVKNGSIEEFNDGWFFVEADGSLTEFNDFGKAIDKRRIELVHNLDGLNKSYNAIGFYNYYSAVQVHLNNKSVYSYGSLRDINKGVLLGNYYSMVDIHDEPSVENSVRITYLSDEPQYIYGFTIGSGPALEMHMVREYISTLIMPIMTILFIIVSVIMTVKETTKDLVSKSHAWLIIFMVCISLWEVADSQLLMDIGMPAGKVCLLSFEIYMLLPVSMMMYLFHSCSYFRKTNLWITNIVVINFAVLNILAAADVMSLLQSLLSTHICVGGALLFGTVQAICEYVKKPGKQSALLAIGLGAFSTFSLIQYLSFFVNAAASNSKIMQIGVIVFSILQISEILGNVNDKISRVNKQLKVRNRLLEKAFGSFLPMEIAQDFTDAPESYSFGGSVSKLTVLQSDIRGFSELIQDLPAADTIDMLNHYLEAMTIIIRRYGGIIMEFIGDGIMATFSADTLGDEHANKALFAAVEMQRHMAEIDEWNTEHGYPLFEMGIGLNTGTAYVGYIGSAARMKYDALGDTINMGSRIESYSTGGQILISDSCLKASTLNLLVEDSIKVLPKGSVEEIEIHLINGIGSPYNIICTDNAHVPKFLDEPIAVEFYAVENKFCGDELHKGLIIAESDTGAMLQTDCPLKLFDNIRINSPQIVSCKVMSKSKNGFLIRFTSAIKGDINNEQ